MSASKKTVARTTSTTTRPKKAAPHPASGTLVRNGAALLAATLTVAAVARLFAFGAWLQLGLIVGVCAGLLATSPVWAAGIAAGAVLLGLAATLGTFGDQAGLPMVVAVVAAPALSWIVARRPKATGWVTCAAIALIVANMWATTLYVSLPGKTGVTTVTQELATSPKAGDQWNDGEFYRRVLWHMRAGEGYYPAFRQAYNENAKWRMDPPSVISYRLPTAFWFWTSLPGGPIAIIVAWLVVSTGALVAGVRLAAMRVPLAYTLPAAAGLATYLIYFGTATTIIFTEEWAAALGLVAVAAAVWSYRSDAWRAWTITAVALAVLACLFRELMLFLPAAGLVAAAVIGGPQRRFRMLAWGAGIVVFSAAYAAHAAAVGAAVSGLNTQGFASGGLRFLADGFSWASEIIGGGAAVLALFAVMAAVGIWRVRDPGVRWFLAVTAALPLAVFLVLGNDARFDNGTSTNYWATIVVPVLIALSPWAFRAVPGLGLPDEDDRALLAPAAAPRS